MELINILYPSDGYICTVEISKTPEGKSISRHHWFDDAESAYSWAMKLDGAGRTVFIAQASFKEQGTEWRGRKGENALKLKNYFLDIDCGEGKGYQDQKAGMTALLKFCKATLLPAPTIVSSGNGLYAHWVLTEALPVSLWKSGALLLKKLVEHHEPNLDADGLICDVARILRPVGVHNRKDPENPKLVTTLYAGQMISPVEMIRKIKNAADTIGIKLPSPSEPKPEINAALLAGLDNDVPSSATLISTKCAQLEHIRSTRGDVPEPLWYSAIGLMLFCSEGEELIHEWSQGHASYDASVTDAKIEARRKTGYGPTTCAHFSAVNPTLCQGCVHVDKITSPIQLGKSLPEPLKRDEASPESIYPEPPRGYTITEGGVYWAEGGEPCRVYEYPIWVQTVNQDYHGESFTLMHRLPNLGWRETTIASNILTEPKRFFAALLTNSIHVRGNKGLFMAYIETFMAQFRHNNRMPKMSSQMGWRVEEGTDDLMFVLGPEVHYKDGTTIKAGYSASAPEFVKDLTPHGDMQKWIDSTVILNREGMEGLAFLFSVVAWGAPLMRFAGYEGALVSVVGGSGLGKSMVGRWGMSAWGDPRTLTLLEDDTKNSLVSRLGTMNTLPIYIDEITNIKPEMISDIAYKVTQGRDKLRMTRNAVEKNNINKWNTIAAMSSNYPLADKLLALKIDANPELNRIFEYTVTEGFGIEDGKLIYDMMENNHGHAGRIYAKHITEKQGEHKTALGKITSYLQAKAKTAPDDRFWVAVGACAVYGSLMAKELGLSRVDIKQMTDWVVDTISDLRHHKKQNSFDPVSFLGSILDRNINHVLILDKYDPKLNTNAIGLRGMLHGRIVARIEQDKQRMWVSRDLLSHEMAKAHISSKKFASLLQGKGLISNSARISLARGSIYQGFTQQCWEFDLSNPALGATHMSLVKGEGEEAAKEVVK